MGFWSNSARAKTAAAGQRSSLACSVLRGSGCVGRARRNFRTIMEVPVTATFSVEPRVVIHAPALLRIWHLASLDAPTVAVVWTLALARVAGVRMPFWVPAVIALAAWCCYVFDRILDARSARSPLRTRHHFHWRYRRIFIPAALGAAITAVALVLHSMPVVAKERNSVLAVAAIAYFTTVHSPWRPRMSRFRVRMPKEFLVGLLFTLACVAPVWFRAPAYRVELLPAVLGFIALAWLNCHAIESWESETLLPEMAKVFVAALVVCAVTMLAAVWVASCHQPRVALLLALSATSAAALAVLDRGRSYLDPIALRAAADFVLLTPVVMLACK